MSPGAAVIKHYQIVSCLGQGGFGKVFEAWDSKLQRSVAIKCLNADGLLSPATDLLREARMAASLNHPAFVKIHALEDDENSIAIVMELIKGETLKQVITNNQPGHAQSIKIIRQIAEAMQQAHDLGLTHGDLKPSNIMLEPSGAIRILDFGLASKADQEATTSMLQQDPQGTIAYMAPERLLGAPLAPQTDLYALGVIFYELLNGQRPFAELSGLPLAAALVQSSSDQWNYLRELSPPLIYLIRRMTAKQPSQRLSSMTKLLIELDNFEKGGTARTDSGQSDKTIPEKESSEFSPTLSKKQLRNKHFKNAILFSTLVISSVVFGGWLTRNVLWHFEEVIPRYSESQEMKLGMDALEQWDRPGSLDTAIKHFNNLAEQNPENAAAIAGLSIAYSLKYQGDTQDEIWLSKAMASAQQAVKLDANLVLGHIALARSLLGQGQLNAALNYADSALLMDSENIFAWQLKIDILYKMELYGQALQLAEMKLKEFPGSRVFWDAAGIAYNRLGRYREAEVALRQSINIQPDSVYAYANLGATLLYQNRVQDALQVFQAGLQIRPSAFLYTNLGNALFFSGRYVEAVAAFEAAVSPKLGNAGEYLGWANLADSLLWIPGRKKEAKKCYEKASQLLRPILERNPSSNELISRMSLYRARLGDKQDSLALIKKLALSESVSPGLHYRVGLIYELVGERDLSLQQIIRAASYGYPVAMVEMDPDMESLRRDERYNLNKN